MGPSSKISIDCFIRASSSCTTVDNTVDSLHDLKEKGVIDTVETNIWPTRICVTAHTADSAVLSQYNRLQAWADRMGVSLQPSFKRQTQTSMVDTTTKTVLRLPVICLAISIDDDLATVIPHTTDQTYTISDALADLNSVSRNELVAAASEHLSSNSNRAERTSHTAVGPQLDRDRSNPVDTSTGDSVQGLDE